MRGTPSGIAPILKVGFGGQSRLVGKSELNAESPGVQLEPLFEPPWQTFGPAHEPAPPPGHSLPGTLAGPALRIDAECNNRAGDATVL